MFLGATYFFKNRDFWKFNDLRMRVEQEEPRSIGEFWFNCTSTGGNGRNGDRWPVTKNKGRTNSQKGVGSRGGRFRTADDESSDGDSSRSIATDSTPSPIVAWSVAMASVATIARWARWKSPCEKPTRVRHILLYLCNVFIILLNIVIPIVIYKCIIVRDVRQSPPVVECDDFGIGKISRFYRVIRSNNNNIM